MTKEFSQYEDLYLWTVGYSYPSMAFRYNRELLIVTKRRSFAEALAKAKKWVKQSEYTSEDAVKIEKVELTGTIDA